MQFRKPEYPRFEVPPGYELKTQKDYQNLQPYKKYNEIFESEYNAINMAILDDLDIPKRRLQTAEELLKS